MKIEKLHLVSFKGFRDFVVDMSPFTCLVGPNNGGKTSVLHAVQLLHCIFKFAFGNGPKPDYGRVQWVANPSQSLQRLSFGDPDALWLYKRTVEPCIIEASLSGGIELCLNITGRSQYTLSMNVQGAPVMQRTNDPSVRAVIEQLYVVNPAYVPPVGAVSPREHFQFQPSVSQLLDQGQGTSCWRSQLYWLYNDGDRETFDRLVQRIKDYLPDATILPPRLTHGNPPDVLIEFQEENITFDISTSGGGLRSMLNLAVVLQFSGSRWLLLDEPDAHLHGSLQRAMARMLLDFSQEEDIQVIVASHAAEMISEVPIEMQTWIDRKKTKATRTTHVATFLAELGALSKADAIRAVGADKVLFLEGDLDKRLLTHLLSLSGLRNPGQDPQVIVATLPSGKGDSVHLRMFHRLLFETFRLDVRVACITDRDFTLEAGGEQDNETLVVALGRKEVENFFLVPETLHAAIISGAGKRRQRTGQAITTPTVEEIQQALNLIVNQTNIKDKLRWQMGSQYADTLDKRNHPATRAEMVDKWFDSRWADPDWRAKNCPGKQVLAAFRKWCQERCGVTLTSTELVRSVTECPADIRTIAHEIENHFYG